jgi:hypothetical protein
MHMNLEERRVILDRGFDRALEVVLDVFLREGFTVTPTGAGDLHRPGRAGHARRYATLDAGLPELNFCRATPGPQALLRCRVSMFELAGSCTLVTIEEPVAHYPLLAGLVPRIAERIGHAMDRLRRLERLDSVDAWVA